MSLLATTPSVRFLITKLTFEELLDLIEHVDQEVYLVDTLKQMCDLYDLQVSDRRELNKHFYARLYKILVG